MDSDTAVLEAREGFLSAPTPNRAMITGGVCSAYGLRKWGHLFAPRQLVALTTFSDLVGEARERVLVDARAADPIDNRAPLYADGNGVTAYADAVATCLAFGLGKIANTGSSLVGWMSDRGAFRETFARQAIPMVWDFAEANAFADAGGSFSNAVEKGAMAIEEAPACSSGSIKLLAAQRNSFGREPILVSTDPPYYDNIRYAELSDFFYGWLRRSLSGLWPDLFRRLTTTKDEELVAIPYRHGGKQEAEAFLCEG